MRILAWLLPDASFGERHEGWTRRNYRPRHGRPPLPVRGWQAAANVALAVQRRHLDIPEGESMARASKPSPKPSLVLQNAATLTRARCSSDGSGSALSSLPSITARQEGR